MTSLNHQRSKTAVVIFNHALRLDDHPALQQACHHDTLIPVVIAAKSDLSPLKHIWQQQALHTLKHTLESLRSTLLLLSSQQFEDLSQHQDIIVYTSEPRLLIDPDAIENLPKHYTPFRNWALDTLATEQPICLHAPTKLPALPSWINDIPSLPIEANDGCPHTPSLPWIISEADALMHWQRYLTHHLHHYKDTRNDLMGLDFSSKLSLALAQGLISVRRCWHDLMAQAADAHTQWLGYELLWRDFFHHVKQHTPHNNTLFSMDILPLTQQINTACQDQPFARAMVQELTETGYLSNRSRQILASFLLYQSKCSWQQGEAFYAYHLRDYDAALNEGNWRYIAGVGADPRGGRIFNLDKQIQQYDANGDYRQYWLSHTTQSS